MFAGIVSEGEMCMKIFKDSSGVYTEEALEVLQDIEDVLKPLIDKGLANGMSIDQISFLTTQTLNSLALDVLIGLNDKQKGVTAW